MSVSLKGVNLSIPNCPIHFESFNDESAILKEAQYPNLLS